MDIHLSGHKQKEYPKRMRGRPKKPVSVVMQPKPERQLPPQPDEYTFALDIGTRTVIGIVGAYVDDKFIVADYEKMEHPGRAMLDGQVEDIAQVGALIKEVKTRLEDRLRFKLERVAIAAAGRALRTVRSKTERTMEPRELATRDVVLGLEGEALELAQAQVQASEDRPAGGYYCVGYSVVEYTMDGAPISQLLGHTFSHASVELIAAFLPNCVVEGLYSAVDLSDLEVISLTLEPIAAMNVLIPQELRLLNLALVDIGAGTSDIAVCREGVIVSYEMATIAGDEVTEEILKRYLVDFETAETMKRSLTQGESVTYENILGLEDTLSAEEIYETVKPVAQRLAEKIAERITECNGMPPAAVFMIGGGSQVPGLDAMLAECLNIDPKNIAVGARRVFKAVETGTFDGLRGPEFITPLGIALTALTQECFHFYGVTVNGKRLKLLNTERVRCMDVLFMAGYRTYQMIGQSGRNLMFTLNGQTRVIKGDLPEHAVLTINGKPGSIESDVRPGDVLLFESARHGSPARASIADVYAEMEISNLPKGNVTIDGKNVELGLVIKANGIKVGMDYEIKAKDVIELRAVRTLEDVARVMPLEESYYCEGTQVEFDIPLTDSMSLSSQDEQAEEALEPEIEEFEPEPEIEELEPETEPEIINMISLTLNNEELTLNAPEGHLLLMHLLERANVNEQEPEGVLVMKVNNREAGFTTPVRAGDTVQIGWSQA